MIHIIITTLNYLPYTQLCVRAIMENTGQPYRIILVDDASTDGTVEWAKTVPQLTIVENTGKRHGWWQGNNLGLDVGPADYYAFLDRDMVVTRNWLTKLIELLEKHPEVGVASPVASNGPGEQAVPQGSNTVVWPGGWPGKQWIPEVLAYEEIQTFGAYNEDRLRGLWIYNAPLWFHCVVMPHRTVERVGRFDERFFWCDGDIDYSYRVLKAGLLTAVRLDTYAHHQGMAYAGPNRWDSGHFGPQPTTFWYEKYPGTSPSTPEGKDWNLLLPHKDFMNV